MQSRFSGKPKRNLTRLASIPSTKDLEYLYSQALQGPGKPIELTFSKGGQCFFVVARYNRRDGEDNLEWTFKRGTEEAAAIEWVYESKDLTMISTLIMTAFPEEDLKSDSNPGMFMPPQPQQPGRPETEATQQLPAMKMGAQSPPPERGALQGDLTKIPMDTILQSISSGKMTGRLEIRDKVREAAIFFREGMAIHAVTQDIEGEQAIIELIGTWNSGEFWFLTDQTTEKVTIQKRLDNLLMQAAALMDHSQFLEKKNLRLESRLTRAIPDLTEQDFEIRLKRAVAVDMSMQKRAYQAIGNGSTLLDILRVLPMTKTEWTPIFFNFVSCALIDIDNTKLDQKPLSLEPGHDVEIDTATLEKFVSGMKRPDSGLYLQMPFLFFMEQEFYRFQCYQVPFSVILMRMAHFKDGSVQPLPSQALKEAIARFDRCRRATDILAHFETFDMALLLPHTDLRSARGFSGRLVELMYSAPLVNGMDASELSISMGIGSMPDDGTDLRNILRIARQRRDTR